MSSPKQVGIKLPGVASITRRGTVDSESSENSADERQEGSAKTIRVIEVLQRYVRGRLERGEFERAADAEGRDEGGDREMRDRPGRTAYEGSEGYRGRKEGQARVGGPGGAIMYPMLRAVQATS